MPAPGVTMMGKRQLLAQLIANLLENAHEVRAHRRPRDAWPRARWAVRIAAGGRATTVPAFAAADRERAQEPFVTLQIRRRQALQRPGPVAGEGHRAPASR